MGVLLILSTLAVLLVETRWMFEGRSCANARDWVSLRTCAAAGCQTHLVLTGVTNVGPPGQSSSPDLLALTA